MKRLLVVLFSACSLVNTTSATAQSLQSYVSDMNKSLGRHGRITLAENARGLINIENDYPPDTQIIAADYGKDESHDKFTAFVYNTALILAPLKYLDEGQIEDFQVFSKEGFLAHKHGEEGDITVVTFKTIGHLKAIDIVTNGGQEKPESKSGGTKTNRFDESLKGASFLVFSDKICAHAFEKALKAAILIVRTTN